MRAFGPGIKGEYLSRSYCEEVVDMSLVKWSPMKEVGDIQLTSTTYLLNS